MRNFITILVIGLLVSGCGFHLQGSRPLPQALTKLTIEYKQPYNVLRPALLKHLQAEVERRGGWVTASRDMETGRLRILELEQEQQALSISPQTGKRIETLLSTSVEFDFVRAGETLLPRQRLVVFREILHDNRQVIAKEYEAEETRAEMQRELANLILLRLETQLAGDDS